MGKDVFTLKPPHNDFGEKLTLSIMQEACGMGISI